jgi:hypothetical protein
MIMDNAKKRKITNNIIGGSVTGFVYALFVGCKFLGFIDAILIFAILGFLYSLFAINLESLSRNSYDLIKILLRPLLKGLATFGVLFLIFWNNSYMHMYVLDKIFLYQQDPEAVAFVSLFFSIIFPLIIFVVNLVSETKNAIRKKTVK